MITLDLTREQFDDMDTVSFYDSKTIFFDVTTILPETLSFKVWGACVMPDFKWSDYIDLNNNPVLKRAIGINKQATTIQGFGLLTFNNIVAGKIVITPYDEDGFLKNKKGEDVEFIREWNINKIDNECYEYWLDTKIYFPYGACDLKLYAKGEVTFEFDPVDCVNGVDYITNPNKNDTFLGYLKHMS